MSPGRIVVLGGATAPLRDIVSDDEVVAVPDIERCLAEVRREDPPATLVVIDPGWPHPLASARRIREHNEAATLVFPVPTPDVDAARSRLAFLPDLRAASVLPIDTGTAELRQRLRDLADTAGRRRQVRSVLDSINRDLTHGGSDPGPDRSAETVSGHYLAALVRHAPDTIVSLDPDGRIVTINEAGQRTLGVDPAEVEGASLRDVLAEADAGDLLRIVAAAAEGEPQANDTLPVHLADGRDLLLSVTAAPIVGDDHALLGIVVIGRDVTAERQAEQQLRALQKAESLATMATGVAHDFNNLLVQAQGWAELASDDPADVEMVTTALANIKEATKNAAQLARSMLVYGGQGRFESKPVQISALISDLAPLLDSTVPAKVDLVLHLDGEVEVRGDPTQLRQVILNLVTNAAEAIGDHGGTITLRTCGGPCPTQTAHAAGSEGVRCAIVEVEDTGPGIDPDAVDRVFDPFYSTKFTGRGLGLAASQGIATAHGGAITVEGRPGRGARFRLHLPAIS